MRLQRGVRRGRPRTCAVVLAAVARREVGAAVAAWPRRRWRSHGRGRALVVSGRGGSGRPPHRGRTPPMLERRRRAPLGRSLVQALDEAAPRPPAISAPTAGGGRATMGRDPLVRPRRWALELNRYGLRAGGGGDTPAPNPRAQAQAVAGWRRHCSTGSPCGPVRALSSQAPLRPRGHRGGAARVSLFRRRRGSPQRRFLPGRRSARLPAAVLALDGLSLVDAPSRVCAGDAPSSARVGGTRLLGVEVAPLAAHQLAFADGGGVFSQPPPPSAAAGHSSGARRTAAERTPLRSAAVSRHRPGPGCCPRWRRHAAAVWRAAGRRPANRPPRHRRPRPPSRVVDLFAAWRPASPSPCGGAVSRRTGGPIGPASAITAQIDSAVAPPTPSTHAAISTHPP